MKLQQSRTSGQYTFHADGLGSTLALTDQAGSVVERYSYDAFGAPTVTDVASGNIGA